MGNRKIEANGMSVPYVASADGGGENVERDRLDRGRASGATMKNARDGVVEPGTSDPGEALLLQVADLVERLGRQRGHQRKCY